MGGKARSADTCAPPGATWHKLHSDLQMAATCDELGGALEKPSCEPSLMATSGRPGAT